MNRLLCSKSLMLAIGAALASGFNFYSFIFLPTFVGTSNLEEFVRANYLGGLYLFSVGSSIAPFSAYVFMNGKGNALLRYTMISLICFALVGVGGIGLVRTSMSLVCLGAAFCMQIAGFFLASLIRQEKIFSASALQILQPMLFAALLTLYEFGDLSKFNWPFSYSLSCFVCVAVMAFFADWKWLIENLSESTFEVTSWNSILARVVITSSFPLFFQLELILVGSFSSINLGDYAMVQKLYASVAISLFGSIGLRLVMVGGDFLKSGQPIVNKKVIAMAFVVLCVVLLVGFGLSFLGNVHVPSMRLVVGSAILSAIYTLASFISMVATTFNPFLALKSFIFSLSVYTVAFYIVAPQDSFDFLMLSGVLFSAYIFFCQFSIFKDFRSRLN